MVAWRGPFLVNPTTAINRLICMQAVASGKADCDKQVSHQVESWCDFVAATCRSCCCCCCGSITTEGNYLCLVCSIYSSLFYISIPFPGPQYKQKTAGWIRVKFSCSVLIFLYIKRHYIQIWGLIMPWWTFDHITVAKHRLSMFHPLHETSSMIQRLPLAVKDFIAVWC